MIIHSDAAEATRQNDKKEQGEEASSENDKFFLHPRFAEGLSDPYAGPADFIEKKNIRIYGQINQKWKYDTGTLYGLLYPSREELTCWSRKGWLTIIYFF